MSSKIGSRLFIKVSHLDQKRAPEANSFEAILERKVSRVKIKLSPDESLRLLMECINRGKVEVNKVRNQPIVAVLGNSGCGKSTLINYLFGCQMGLEGEKIVVLSKAQGGPKDDVVAIRHVPHPSFMPYILVDNPILCDSPGFFNNQGFEVNIARMVNLKQTFAAAGSLKVVLLVNYHTLLSDRSRGLTDMVKVLTTLFGSTESFLQFKNSFLFGVTQIPPTKVLNRDELCAYIRDTNGLGTLEKRVFEAFAERAFIYDPLNRIEGGWKREVIIQNIEALQPIPQGKCPFKTALSPEDEKELREFCETSKRKIQDIFEREDLAKEDFTQAAQLQEAMSQLKSLEYPLINELLKENQKIIIQYFKELIREFTNHCSEETLQGFKQAQVYLKRILDHLHNFDDQIKNSVHKFLESSSPSASSNTGRLVHAHMIQQTKMDQKLQDLFFAAQLEVRKLGDRLSSSLKEFSDQVKGLNQSLTLLTKKLAEELKQKQLTAQRLQQVTILFRLAHTTLELAHQSSLQYLALEQKAVDGGFKSFKGTIELVLYARNLEIEYIRQQLSILDAQNDHEWELTLLLHSQKVKEETLKFDQLLHIQEQKQKELLFQEDQEIEKLKLAFTELKGENQLVYEQQKMYLQQQGRICHLELQGLKESHKMDLETRSLIADFLLNLKHEK